MLKSDLNTFVCISRIQKCAILVQWLLKELLLLLFLGPPKHYPTDRVLRGNRQVLLDFWEGIGWSTSWSYPDKVDIININTYLTRAGYLNFRIFSKWKGQQLTHRRLYKIWVLFTTKVVIKTKNPSFTILRLINSSNWGMFPKIPWLTLVNTYQISDYLKGLLSRPRILTFDFFF